MARRDQGSSVGIPGILRRLGLLGLVVAAGVGAWSVAGAGAQLGQTTIALTSVQYYAWGDYTRFTYQVTVPSRAPIPAYWILGVGDCVDDDVVVWYLSSSYTWVQTPFRGMRFTCSSRNQKFYLYLEGNWTAQETQVAAGWSSPPTVLTGWIDGPACASASISLDVASGDSISFPSVVGAGTYPASSETVLRVTSSTAGWTLGYALTFSIPADASQAVVEEIFQVAPGTYTSAAGITDVAVAYTLVVDLEDFAGLPQGSYVITIAYTATTD